MKQHEAVEEAMRTNGGYATLGLLNQTAPKIAGSLWETKTPFASIRRIVQTNEKFFRIRPGLWGLSENRQTILDELGLGPKTSPARQEELTHGYYQGLLLEIGNWSSKQTFVPAQDKNRLFLNRKLSEVASLSEYYEYTYAPVLNRTRTIDVTWFNSRRYPDSVFEVEHSTDIYNSLLKFMELQDFHVKLHIVADSVRKNEYLDKLKSSAFEPIQQRVEFLDYDTLAQRHTLLSQLTMLGR